MTTYDKDKVDALLDSLNDWGGNLPGRILKQMWDIRPNTDKFYVLPEWDEFYNGPRQDLHWDVLISRAATHNEDEQLWNAIREATATDKPMVHIPAGCEWSKADLLKLREAFWSVIVGADDDFLRFRTAIDAIKAKLEGGKRCQ